MILGLSGKISSGKDTVAQMIQFVHDSNQLNYPITMGNYKGYFNNEHNKKSVWQIKRFADKLKDMVCLMVGCTREQLEDREFKEKPLGKEWNYFEAFTGSKRKVYASREDFPYDASHFPELQMTPRKLMQLLGTEAGREIIHPNLWANSLFSEYKTKRVRKEGVPLSYGEYELKKPNWIIPDTRFPNEAKAIKDRGGILIRVNRPNIPKIGDEVKVLELDNYTKKFRSKISLPIRAIVKEVYNPEILVSIDGIDEEIDLYEWQYRTINLSNHLSETALDDYKDWDYIIDNNGSLDDLLIKVKEIYEDVTKQTNFN